MSQNYVMQSHIKNYVNIHHSFMKWWPPPRSPPPGTSLEKVLKCNPNQPRGPTRTHAKCQPGTCFLRHVIALLFFYPSTSHPGIFLPDNIGFAHPNDEWTGLCIKLCMYLYSGGAVCVRLYLNCLFHSK